MNEIVIREVQTQKDLRTFVSFPYRLYRNTPFWVPPIRAVERQQFDPAKNPALDHCNLKLWLAEKNGKIAGCIGCFINDLETQLRGEQQARFNWLEFIDDPQVSKALMETAANWAREQGATLLKGPAGFTNMDATGMTVEGFDERGSMGAPYHPPYYAGHMDALGFEKLTDYLECRLPAPEAVPEKLQRLGPIIEKKYNIRLTYLQSRAELKTLIRKLFGTVLDTYKELPSFVPLSEQQTEFYIKQYQSLLDLDYLPIVRDEGENIIGFGVIIPSYAEALVRSGGRLFPFGFLRLLWTRRHHSAINLVLIGVVEEWRNKGLNALIFANTIQVVRKKGVKDVFINPILEDNQASLALFKDYNPRIFRRRRVFVKKW